MMSDNPIKIGFDKIFVHAQPDPATPGERFKDAILDIRDALLRINLLWIEYVAYLFCAMADLAEKLLS